MDDNSFDKYIKDRVEGFNDSEIDENALAGFHARMNSVSNVPWYYQYKKVATYSAAVLLITALNYGIFSLVHTTSPEKNATDTISNNFTDRNLIDESQKAYLNLMKDFEALKEMKSRVDTVYVYQTVYQNPAQTPESLVSNKKYSGSYKGIMDEEPSTLVNKGRNNAVSEKSYPSEETISFLVQNKLAYIDGDGAIVLKNTETEKINNNNFLKGNTYRELRNSVLPSNEVVKVATPELEEIHVSREIKLSSKTLNAIEKSKMRGIGFQYGPELDLFKLSTNDKVGNPGVSAGIMAEFILSPSWRIETGIKYTYAGYKIDDTQDLGEDLLNFPNINTELGELNQIEQKSHILSFPIHLKYQHPIAEDRAVFASFGLSPQLYLLQKFEYEYMFPIATEEGVFISEIESPNNVEENNIYTGTYDFSLGFEKKLDNKSLLQLSAFYSKSAGGLGVENRELDLIGIRSSIRFRVK